MYVKDFWYTGRSRIRLAFQTHYVGDLRSVLIAPTTVYTATLSQPFLPSQFRAINNELIDTYQLKSLDGLFGNTKCRINSGRHG